MWTGRSLGKGALTDTLAREEEAGLRFAFRLRLVALAAIAVWLMYSVPMPRVLYYIGLIALFIVLCAVPLLLRHQGRRGAAAIALVALLDAALLAYTLLAPNPFVEGSWPPQITLRFHNFLYFFVLLAGTAEWSHLMAPEGVREAIAATGLHERHWRDLTEEAKVWSEKAVAAQAAGRGPSGPALILGPSFAEMVANLRRSLFEDRITVVQAVFDK